VVATLNVLDAGPGVSLQDFGRPGYQRFGITEGGVMDRWALAEVNLLLGNPAHTAALEMIMTGGSFTISDGAVKIATSGAEMELTVDGKPVVWRSSFMLEAGQVLRCGYTRSSIYSYLQVAGGFTTTPVMGSSSTHSRSGFGGFNGHLIAAGDELPLAIDSQTLNGNQVSTQPQRLEVADYLTTDTIRVVWGTQADVFSEEVRDVLLQSDFCVSAQRDRMGARLSTDAGSMAAKAGLSGVSDVVLIGDIQVAGDGVATVLLSDRQPTGGYPRIATVITADLDAISQMPTGQSFRFELVTAAEAVEALRNQKQMLDGLSSKLISVTRLPEDIPDLLSYNLIDGVVAPK